MSNILDNKRRNQILGSFGKPVEVEKAYTEGIYADTPANRKLGRVGMSYISWGEYIKAKEKDPNINIKQFQGENNLKAKNLNSIKNEEQSESNNELIPVVHISDYKSIPTKTTLKKLKEDTLKKLKEDIANQVEKEKKAKMKVFLDTSIPFPARKQYSKDANSWIKRGKSLIETIDTILSEK